MSGRRIAKWGGVAAALLLQGSAAAGSPQTLAIAPPHLSKWMADRSGARPRLRLRQTLTLDRETMTVCRTLTNIDRRVLRFAPLTPDGDGNGQFGSFVFDRAGDLWEGDRPVGAHRLFIPPPLPPPGGSWPSTSLTPRQSFRNCERLSRPRLKAFSVVSNFLPVDVVIRALGTPEAGTNVVSNACYVWAEKVACAALGRGRSTAPRPAGRRGGAA